MELTKQVCSLELAKKLKELGMKQESLFKWHSKIDIKGNNVHTELIYFPVEPMEQDFSAFTVAELGEMLPSSITGSNLQSWKTKKGWTFAYYPHHKFMADTEADARAKMLVYLLENELLKT